MVAMRDTSNEGVSSAFGSFCIDLAKAFLTANCILLTNGNTLLHYQVSRLQLQQCYLLMTMLSLQQCYYSLLERCHQHARLYAVLLH